MSSTPFRSAGVAVQRAAMSRNDIKILTLASLGGALEYYDFIVAVFFTKLLATVFFPERTPEWLAQLEVFCIFAAGCLVRPIGGVFFAPFGDRIGRKKMFSLSLFLMAAPTLLIGLLPIYATFGIGAPLLFLLCRVLQGLSVGGEVPGAWIFCSEHVRRDRVGLACGLLMAGLCVGILLGALSAKSLGFTGFALSYNNAYALFGGTAPAIASFLVGKQGLTMAPAWYLAALCVLGAVVGMVWKPPVGDSVGNVH
jgi:MFS family permease